MVADYIFDLEILSAQPTSAVFPIHLFLVAHRSIKVYNSGLPNATGRTAKISPGFEVKLSGRIALKRGFVVHFTDNLSVLTVPDEKLHSLK